MKILITRPEVDAAPLAQQLKRLAIDSWIEPLLSIQPLPVDPPPLELYVGLLITSANGIRVIAELVTARDLAVYCVGEASQRAATSLGFNRTYSANGDVHELVQLVQREIPPGQGRLLHVAGVAVAGDLASALTQLGYLVDKFECYEAKKADHLSMPVVKALRAGEFQAVALFSPRTAENFVHLVAQEGLTSCLKSLTAFCLSANVADKLARVDWHEIKVAARPDNPSMVALIKQWGQNMAEPDTNPTTIPPAKVERTSTPPAPKSGVSKFGLIVGMVIAAGAGAMGGPILHQVLGSALPENIRNLLPDPTVPERLSRTENKLDQVQVQLTQVDLAKLQARLDQATGELDQLRQEIHGSSELKDLAVRVDGIGNMMSEIAKAPQMAAARLDGTAAELKTRMAEVEAKAAKAENIAATRIQEKLDPLESSVDRNNARLHEFEDRVGKLEKLATVGDRRAALALAIGQLRAAALTGKPFADELFTVRAMLPQDETGLHPDAAKAMEELAGLALSGAASLDQLKKSLNQNIRLALAAERFAPDGNSLDQLMNRATSIISIRRTDHVSGNSAEAILARSEEFLGQQNLTAALEEVGKLRGPAVDVMAEWTNQANAYQVTQKSIKKLESYAVKLLASGGTKG